MNFLKLAFGVHNLANSNQFQLDQLHAWRIVGLRLASGMGAVHWEGCG